MASTPERPSIQLFAPFASKISVCGEPYHDDDGQAHTEAGVRLRESNGTIILTQDSLAATNLHVITGLSLTRGETYSVQMRYRNATGWGSYGPWYAERVPLQLTDYTEASVPAVPTDGGEAPSTPEYPQAVVTIRPIVDEQVESGQSHRRPLGTVPIRRAEIHWFNLTDAQRSTLVSFLEARIDAAEGFTIPGAVLNNRRWWAEAGTIRSHKRTHKAWIVSINAMEVAVA